MQSILTVWAGHGLKHMAMMISYGGMYLPGVKQLHQDIARNGMYVLYDDGSTRWVGDAIIHTYGPVALLQQFSTLQIGANTYGVSWTSAQSAAGGGGNHYNAGIHQLIAAGQQLINHQLASNLYGNPLYNNLGGLAGTASGAGGLAQQLVSWSDLPTYSSEPLPKAEPEVGKIIGWRVWRYDVDSRLLGRMFGSDLVRLKSLSQDCVWQPGAPMTGTPGDYDLDTAGVYAFKTKEGMMAEFGTYPDLIYGTVALWGKVVEHELGYRAENAEIVSLDGVTLLIGTIYPSGYEDLLDTLRRKYLPQKAKTDEIIKKAVQYVTKPKPEPQREHNSERWTGRPSAKN